MYGWPPFTIHPVSLTTLYHLNVTGETSTIDHNYNVFILTFHEFGTTFLIHYANDK